MPKTLQFRSGSVIYFQGDTADKIFILQTGQVNLVYQDIETGDDVHEFIQPGEFFGVKSTLGRYPREENAIALQDTTIIAFTASEFESLAMANTNIIMKMLKIFSSQLRRIHQQVSSLLENKEQPDPDRGLFSIGEYYINNKKYSQAKYVFNRYLMCYPKGRDAARAKKNLEIAELYTGTASSANSGVSRDILSYTEPESAASQKNENLSDTTIAYNTAVSYMSLGKYQQAYIAFSKIIQSEADLDCIVKCSYELGRCLFLLAKYRDCIKYYTMMITKYPKHPNLADALGFMGQSYEMLGKQEQAMVFFEKARSISGEKEAVPQEETRQPLKAVET
jgi:CRP-like cAMP-binding protein